MGSVGILGSASLVYPLKLPTETSVDPDFLNAGIDWGGNCLGKDMKGLMNTAREYELDTPLLAAVMTVNERQRGVVVLMLQRELHVLPGSHIGLLGIAFKPGTDDLRDAPSLDSARRLLPLGQASRPTTQW